MTWLIAPVGGTAVRISANEIVTDDLEYVIKISSAKSGYTRSDYYGITAFDWEANHVFCETDEARHLESRNKVAPGVCIPSITGCLFADN